MQDRRRDKRIFAQQPVTLSFGNGGHQITALSGNISSSGVLIHCDRFLAVGSQVALILDFPSGLTEADAPRVLCKARILRIDEQLTEGKFGVALVFTSVQPLPEA